MTGGLDGLGLATARWLAERGARSLVLIGRRGLDTPGAREAVAEFEADGVQVLARGWTSATRANSLGRRLIR